MDTQPITRTSGHLWTGGEVVTPAKLNQSVSQMRLGAPPPLMVRQFLYIRNSRFRK